MGSEKTPALLIPQHYDEKNLKDKNCSKSFLSWVLAALLIALIVALCIQFLFPVVGRRYKSDIDTVHVYQGTPIVHINSRDDAEKELSKEEINPQWHLDFLINPTRLCDTLNPPDSEAYKKDPEVKLLVLVPSALNHFEERKTIRKTWGSMANQQHGPMRLGFVLGTTPNATEEDLIMRESELYGDIIQADFQDTYRNLTTKSVLMLKWVSKHCAHAQYFLKADDDTFVNLNVLTNLLQKSPFAEEEKFIGGFIHRGAQPSRTPTEKYYVSEEDYADSLYPPYASGAAYLTNGPTASKLFDASKSVKPFLPMEDVFVTGLCADEIAATLIHEPSFRYVDPPDPLEWNHYSSLATAHSVTPDNIELLWDQMTKHLFDIFDFPDSIQSSSDSSEWFDGKSVLDLFNWPKDNKYSHTDSTIFNNIAEKLNSPQIKAEARNWQSNEINPDTWKDKGAITNPINKKPNSLEEIFRNLARNPDNDLKSQESLESDLMKWPSLPLFPFGLGKQGTPSVNITYFLLK
ncbi:lactosylceramide 1,3-N-acetyl-beta-D-glucosaminyltransferase [Nephila pilipes]|uniref:Lactosylceramide 1,3-N-acetyl-beta-D-glucosaminyltransferase n=1 Tax=Nephila pilipes TaxID=299642 RepID=A0A8X6UF27_NEPPI|nr:lactosylceramide 1,3-N-acetyl-beta-D-glucosaminyltransferase [Nephila pilipes]